MLGALTSRTRATTDALLREARFDAATVHERHSAGEPSPSWSNGSCDITVLLFTTNIKQCVRFSPPHNCSFKLEIAFCVRGVLSPLIANVYLHYLFDLWAHVWRKKVAKGDVIVVRYADDLVVGFQHRTEAEQFLKQFRERLAKFGLELHPDKTRLIEFGRFAARDRKERGEGKPETFTFLGFTHYCGQRHKSGTFTVGRITAKKRMVAKLKAIKVELQRRMHDRMAEVGTWLRKVVLGYYQYHAVPGNTTQLRIFKLRVCRLWQSVLVRRSQRAQMRWERFTPVLNRWIPPPRVLHHYPDARFYATHPS